MMMGGVEQKLTDNRDTVILYYCSHINNRYSYIKCSSQFYTVYFNRYIFFT